MDLILDYLARHLPFLWRHGRFQITDSRSDRSNGGDGLLTVESPDLRIRFTCDRRQLMADVQPSRDHAEWYSIDLLRRLWTGRAESSAVLDASYAAFLRDNLSAIEGLVAGDEWPAAEAQLKDLKAKRSTELFGGAAATRTDRAGGAGASTDRETWFLSSLDSQRFKPVRRCELGADVDLDTGKRGVIAEIEPPVLGQDFGRSADIGSVILTPRHAGASLRPVEEFPCFVHIAITTQEDQPVVSPVSAADLTIIGWGELYRTADDAESNRFD